MPIHFPGNPDNPYKVKQIEGFPPEAYDPMLYTDVQFTKGRIRVEPYKHHIINDVRDRKKTLLLRYWGAVGDFMYFLTFIHYVLKLHEGARTILAADTYRRYAGHPLMEMCQQNGLIDELWLHKRKGGGPDCHPSEHWVQAEVDHPDVTMYTNGIYYDQTLMGPGVKEWPLKEMRAATVKERFLIPIMDRETLLSTYSKLPKDYITLHPKTFGKNMKNEVPANLLQALGHLPLPVVVLQFYMENYDHVIAYSPNLRVFEVSDTTTSIWVQAHARFHVGIESSQLLAAAIHGVHVYCTPFSTLGMFERDLGIAKYLHNLPWDSSPQEYFDVFTRALEKHPSVEPEEESDV